MTRQEKFPNTQYFKYYNANPKNRLTDDCVVRALCTFLDEDYIKVYTELFALSIKTGYSIGSRNLYSRYLSEKGYRKQKMPRKLDGKRYTAKEFCLYKTSMTKRYFAHIGGNHVAAIIGSQVIDIWDCTDGCIGNYWERDDI